MKLLMVYFSPTGNTRKVAQAVADRCDQLGSDVTLWDMTLPLQRQKNVELTAFDAFVFGFPVHSLRAPRLVRQWLRTWQGEKKRCAMFFTYGGFSVHPAHYSTGKILEQQGFRVVASAQFPSAHTYNRGGWEALPHRPNNEDLEEARNYADAVYPRLMGTDNKRPPAFEQGQYTTKQLDAFEDFRYQVVSQLPTRSGVECCLCRQCEKMCPVGVFAAEPGEVVRAGCLACLACVAICPEQVLHINDTHATWEKKLHMGQTSASVLNRQKSVFYL